MNRPSRFLAPLCLLAALLAVFLIVSGTTGDDGGDSGSDKQPTSEERKEARTTADGETTPRTTATKKRRTYTVKPGDTLAAISERTGVTVEEILELNEDLDANSLTVGDKIKLTE
jgi:LysM repeat protein